MSFFSRLSSSRRKHQKSCQCGSACLPGLGNRPLRFESLEDRHLLSAVLGSGAGLRESPDWNDETGLAASSLGLDVPSITAVNYGSLDLTQTSVDPCVVTTDLDIVDSADDVTSLREAIAYANSHEGGDTITFDASLTNHTITLTNGELAITDATGETSIIGLGADYLTVSGNDASRVFYIDSAVAHISGLTITQGYVDESAYFGGGIENYYGALTVSDSIITGNAVAGAGGGLCNYGGEAAISGCLITGNTADDGGGGVCNFSGVMTIAESVFSANSADGGGGVYNTKDATLTISTCALSENTAISFGGAVANSGALTMTNAILSGNSTSGGDGGGLFNNGQAEITGVTISDNSASDAGGGLSNTSDLTITDSAISGNVAVAGGGGFYNYGDSTLTNCTLSENASAYGGGIYNDGSSVTCVDCSLSDNAATYGGGVYTYSGTLTITDCTLTGNTADNNGGGIESEYGTVTVTGSTFSGNSATNYTGGGIDSASGTLTLVASALIGNTAGAGGGGVCNFGTSTITNCTLTGNSAAYGGGIYNDAEVVTCVHCTISGNTATSGGGVYNFDGHAATVLNNSILANNTNTDATSPEACGTLIANYCLIEDPVGTLLSDTSADNVFGVDPNLGPLGYYGGATQTLPLLEGSAAIDAGSNGLIPSGTATDQRGYARIVNDTTDLGASEYQGPVTQQATASVTALNVLPGQAFQFTVAYTALSGDNTLTGLGLRIHYNSQVLTLSGLSDILPTGYVMQQGALDDTADYDGDPATDKYVLIAWADANEQWPGTALPADLLTIAFTLSPLATVGTGSVIRFSSASTAAGYSFAGQPVVVTAMAPTATVALDNPAPKSGDTLTATATKSGVSAAAVSLTFTWKVDGVVRRTFTSATALSDTLDLSLPGNGDRNSMITVEVTPTEETVSGATASDTATVANTAPTVGVRLNSAAPKTNDVLTATATKSDIDGDTVALTFVWKVNGVAQRRFTTSDLLTDTFDLGVAGHGDKGDVVTVEVTSSDGINSGTTASDSATVGETAPQVTVTTPTSPQSGDVTINYTLMDADADPCAVLIEYSMDGGATWHTATTGAGSEGLAGLASSPAGSGHAFVWASGIDLAGAAYTGVLLRVTPTDTLSGVAAVTDAFAVDNADLPEQSVYGSSDTKYIVPGQSFDFNVVYTTSDNDSALTTLGLRIHYNSQAMSFLGLSNVLQTGYIMQQGPVDDTENFDGDAATDKYVVIVWSDASGQWPSMALPAELLTVAFTLSSSTTPGASAAVRFSSASTADGYAFTSEPVIISAVAINLDASGDGAADATDGVLALRYLFGFRGDALIAGVETVANSVELAAQFDTARLGMLDVDGNGLADALTDGILIERYLAHGSGPSLVQGALGANATRTTSEAIIDFLDSYMPSMSGQTIVPADIAANELVSALSAQTSRIEPAVAMAVESTVDNAAEGGNQQLITPDPQTQTITAGSAVAIDVDYSTSSVDATLTGLGLQVFYDSSKLTLDGATNILASGFVQQQGPQADLSDLDNDASTDTYVLIAWADSSESWPGESTVRLFTLNFSSASTATGSTSVNFAPASTAAGWTLGAASAAISFSPANQASGSLSGYVYVDAARTGQYLVGEGLPGVTVAISGLVQRTTTTDSNGYYEFTALPAGVYAITETQPAACFDGGQHSIPAITLASDAELTGQNFREIGLRPEYIPNAVLSASSLPVGSTAWKRGMQDALTQAETAAGNLAPTTLLSSTATASSAVVTGYEIARPSASTLPTANKASTPRETTPLTAAELAKTVDAAIVLWAAAGLPAQDAARLRSANVAAADLPGLELGWTTRSGVVIDSDAAGYGWFVDPTPDVNEEFSIGNDGQQNAISPAAVDRMDLLTVVEHELGHFLGLDDSDAAASCGELMSGTLGQGIRRLPDAATVDAVLAANGWDD